MQLDPLAEEVITSFSNLLDRLTDAPSLSEQIERFAPTLILHPDIAKLSRHLEAINAAATASHPYSTMLLWELSTHISGHSHVDLALLEAAEATLRARGDLHGVGLAKALAGTRYLVTGQIDLVAPTLDESRRLLGADSPHMESLLANMSWTPYALGDLGSASALAEQAISQAQVRGNSFGEGLGWFHAGFFAVWRGDLKSAESAFRNAIAALDDKSELFETPMAHGGLGLVSAARGRFVDAEQHFTRAFAAAATNPGFGAWLTAAIGAIRAEYFATHRPEHSLHEARNSRREMIAQNDDWWARWALRSSARALTASGQSEAARRCLEELVITETNILERAHSLALLGDLVLDTEQERGRSLLREALGTFASSGADLRAVETTVYLLRSKPQDARQLRVAAQTLTRHDRAYDLAWRGGTTLEVRVLGTATTLLDGAPVVFPTVRAEEAFYALATHPNNAINAEALGTLIWPDATAATITQRVNTLVWQLRTCLGRAGERIQRHRQVVTLNIDNSECDLRRCLGHDLRPSGPSDPRRRPRPAELTDEARSQLRRPVLPRFSASEWVIDLQHRVNAAIDPPIGSPGR